MDSQHRHELKENDLAIAIGSMKQWWAKHQMKVLGAAVVLAAVILAARYYYESRWASREGEQYQLATAPTPEAYRSLAQATSNRSIQVHANLRGAEALLKSLRTAPVPVTAEKRKQSLDSAEAMYKAALADAEHPLTRIKAHIGLAVIAETRGDWDAAREQYQAVQKAGGPGYEYLMKQAAAFEAALPSVQIPPVYGRASAKKDDLFKLPLPDGSEGSDLFKDSGLLFPKDDDKKGPLRDNESPSPLPSPVPAPAPEKDAKPAPTPDTPEKDAKSPEKDAKSPEKDATAPEKDAKPAPTP